MIFKDKDKEAIKLNQYTTTAKISIVGTDIVFTDDDYLVDFDYEDYRYVPNNGFIGQFVERILDGSLSQLPSNVILEDAEINVQLGIKNALTKETTFYDYGNFLITNVSEQDTNGLMKFESADYTKKFNLKYNDTMTYPCIALQLANNICEQVGVELYTNDICYPYIETDYLAKGTYAMSINGEIYEFSITTDLYKGDTIIFLESKKGVYQKTIDRDYNITRIFIPATKVDSSTNPILNSTKTPFIDFINYDFVIEGNQYEEDNSFRDVMKDISKLAYTWVRVGTDNKVHFDFNVKKASDVDTYNILTTDEYYESSKQDLKFGPVNKVLIGMSQVEGENRYKISSTYTEDTECVVKILDNNLTYTDELRLIALNGSESLFNLEYTPLNINSIGHPWLEADDYIKLINVDGDELYSYPFDRKISYCGYIKGTITSSAQTSNQSKYENPNTMVDRINKTEFVVDKQNQTISAAVTKVEEMEKMVQVDNSTEGYPIEIYDAGAYNLQKNVVYGNSEQATRSGRNLYNFEDTTEVNPIYSVDKDGWITITYDNTNGNKNMFFNYYTNNLNLKTSTDYAIIMEVRSVSGSGNIQTCSHYNNAGQFYNNTDYTFSNLEDNTIYINIRQSKDSFDGLDEKGLRSFVYFTIGKSGSITFRLSVLEDTTINADNFEYEPYGVSPSPEYPSEINNVCNGNWLIEKVNQEDKETILKLDLQGNELCKIGDIADELDLVSGVLTKRIGKVVLDGSESWAKRNDGDGSTTISFSHNISNIGRITQMNNRFQNSTSSTNGIEGLAIPSQLTHIYVQINRSRLSSMDVAGFKTWLSNNPVTVYYVLAEPETIQLDKNNLMLFEGYNLITLDSKIEPNKIVVEYLTDSSLNEQYASKSELIVQSDRITQVTDSTTSISNNLISLTGRVGDIEGQTAEISVINNKVTNLQTSTQSLLKFESDVKENGVTKVHTETNYVFDKDGLVINESNENVSSRLNNKGLAIFDGEIKDNSDDAILYAGYDSKYSSSVLKTQKMIINDKLRFENYTTEDGKEAVGCFWVGD